MTRHPPLTRGVRWLAWATGTCDNDGDPSGGKIGAFAIINTCLVVILQTRQVEPMVAFCLSFALAALISRSAFLHALSRSTFGFSRTETRSDTRSDTRRVELTGNLAEIAKAVQARRDPEAGLEASGRVPQVHHD
jgi:hypothetical protein